MCLQIVFNRCVVQESDIEFKRLRDELWNIRYGPYMALSKLNIYLTNSMKQSPAWEAVSSPASQEIPSHFT